MTSLCCLGIEKNSSRDLPRLSLKRSPGASSDDLSIFVTFDLDKPGRRTKPLVDCFVSVCVPIVGWEVHRQLAVAVGHFIFRPSGVR